MRELDYPFDGEDLLRRKKRLRRMLLGDGSVRLKKRIAVLGGSTTHDVVKLLELFLLDGGIEPEFYESEYNQFYEDAVFSGEELEQFCPDIIYIHTTMRNVQDVLFPQVSDTREQVEENWKRFIGILNRCGNVSRGVFIVRLSKIILTRRHIACWAIWMHGIIGGGDISWESLTCVLLNMPRAMKNC